MNEDSWVEISLRIEIWLLENLRWIKKNKNILQIVTPGVKL